MKAVTLSKYASFQCLAGNCPSTCCSGWGILVDEKDYKRFKDLKPEWLRQDIFSNIRQKGDRYFFKNQINGKCAMLDQDGLCRIQRNTSEEALCNTCRKYPRLINLIEGTVYLSMAASCPVVSEYLVRDVVQWNVAEDSGRMERVMAGELSLTNGVWEMYQELWQAAEGLCEQHSNVSLLYPCFGKMAAEVLGIIAQNSEGSIPAEFFAVLEEDVSEKVKIFLDNERDRWKRILINYMDYRIVNQKIEFPEENDLRCIRQAQGELFLLRTLAFCRFCERDTISYVQWQDLLQRVYRFCVHGRKVAAAFQNLLEDFFSQDVLWSYMLK